MTHTCTQHVVLYRVYMTSQCNFIAIMEKCEQSEQEKKIQTHAYTHTLGTMNSQVAIHVLRYDSISVQMYCFYFEFFYEMKS